MRVLLVVQCFPPRLSTAGGVSKRYYRLCKCLIDEYRHDVTIITPIDIAMNTGDTDIPRWIQSGQLTFLPAHGVLLHTRADGSVLGLNPLSVHNLRLIAERLASSDVLFIDDIPMRTMLASLSVAMNVPCVITSHTDFHKTHTFKNSTWLRWLFDVSHCRFEGPVLHATTTQQYAKERRIPHVWPPMLWSSEFSSESSPEEIAQTRREWIERKRHDVPEGASTVAFEGILLYVGRFSMEKRIELLMTATPKHLLLVIVGDNTTNPSYVESLVHHSRHTPNVLVQVGMVGSRTLRLYYQSCDMFVSASDFETCGNCVVEALTCGTCVAVQPEQGHLEWVQDGQNGFHVNYNVDTAMSRVADAFSKRKDLPQLKGTQQYLRTFDFGQAVHEHLIYEAMSTRATIWQMALCTCHFISMLVSIVPIGWLACGVAWLRSAIHFTYNHSESLHRAT